MTEQALVKKENPQQRLAERKQQAELLRDFIQQQGLSKNFGGPKDHIFYEGWAFLGELGGYYTSTEHIEQLSNEDGKFWGIRASVNLKQQADPEDRVVATVTASCTRDEPNWRSKPPFQLESMAQTRGASKAFRMRLSPIVALAGYSPTPGEEMDGINEGNKGAPPKKSVMTFDKLVDMEKLPPKLVAEFMRDKANADGVSIAEWFEAKEAQAAETADNTPPPIEEEEATA